MLSLCVKIRPPDKEAFSFDKGIYHIYADWCVPGKDNQAFLDSVKAEGNIQFYSYVASDACGCNTE